MRALIGLGNPGEKYERTRHNVGFECLDAVAAALDAAAWKRHSDCLVTEVRIDGQKHFLVKPQQFMNNSGKPIKVFAEYYDIEAKDMCIVADDVYIAPGSARVRRTGADGGHNGWKSIIASFPDGGYERVRVGVGVYPNETAGRHQHPPLDDYVLHRQAPEDVKRTDLLIDKIVPNLVQWLGNGTISEETIHI